MNYLASLSYNLKRFIENKLWAKVLIAMFLGIIAGVLLNWAKEVLPEKTTHVIAGWLAFPGKLFIKLVQMIMIALIVSSIITGLAGSNTLQLKSVGVKLLLYFIFNTAVAVLIGTIITYVINPGKYMSGGFQGEEIPPAKAGGEEALGFSNIPEMILNLIPENPLEAMITGDMLSIVVFSIIIGIAILTLRTQHSQPLLKMMSATQSICMNIVNMAMRIVPYAVFGIMAGLIATTGKESMTGLGVYTLTVLAGLALIIIYYLSLVFFCWQD